MGYPIELKIKGSVGYDDRRVFEAELKLVCAKYGVEIMEVWMDEDGEGTEHSRRL